MSPLDLLDKKDVNYKKKDKRKRKDEIGVLL